MGKVVILAGNKRAGKSTLALLLHKKYNYNYINFDYLLDSIESTFSELEDGNDDKYIKLLEEMVKRSLEDSNNYNISTVYDYIFTPKQLSDFKYRNDVEIYFLANLDANGLNIKEDLINYSKKFDWPSTATDMDLERNIKFILNTNISLIEETKKYNFKLINTSREDSRDKIIKLLAETISDKDLK